MILKTNFSNEKHSVDSVGYKRASTTNATNNFSNIKSNQFSYNSEVSLSKKNSSKSINSNSKQSNSINNVIQTKGNATNLGVSFENKSEDGNISVPHIADFYPEGNRD
jgi:hypothetical protein